MKKTQDLPVVVMKLEIISLSRKKGLEKKVKEKNFGGEVGFRVYDVEKIKEDEEEEDGKEWQICLKKIL